MVRRRWYAEDHDLDPTWPGQDMTRAQPRGDMDAQVVAKVHRLASE
jgi:hypothetical protein